MTGDRLQDAEADVLLAEARALGQQMAEAMDAAERRRVLLRALHDGGWSIRAIAAAVGVSSTAVAQAVRADRHP